MKVLNLILVIVFLVIASASASTSFLKKGAVKQCTSYPKNNCQTDYKGRACQWIARTKSCELKK